MVNTEIRGQATANLKGGETGPGLNLGVCGGEDSLSWTWMAPGAVFSL